jgi:gliotoxin/aspirochlorine biosynthesis aminotransferase
MSSLTAISTTALLSSPQLPGLLELNSTRLSEAYATMTMFLRRHNIEYIPVSYGLFVFARIAPNADTWEDEVTAIDACKEAGVVVSSGKGYHVVEKEKGWARLTFAIKRDLLDEALRRLAIGLGLSEAPLTNGVHDA